MSLCPYCLARGYCRRLQTQIVSDDDIDNSEFIRDVREFAHKLDINDEEWREFLSNLYRDYRGRVADADGNEIFLDMEEFERPSIREWFRDFCCRLPVRHPHVRPEARERVRVLATILKAYNPLAASYWGVRPANDNEPE